MSRKALVTGGSLALLARFSAEHASSRGTCPIDVNDVIDQSCERESFRDISPAGQGELCGETWVLDEAAYRCGQTLWVTR